jgi:predicted nuclease with TOPRIM domain
MPMQSTSPTETIECPLCAGSGKLSRAEILNRLGVRDFARVAQLSAEEAFRLLQNRHDREHENAWSRFETELAKRTAEIRESLNGELRLALSEKDSLTRRVEDSLREIGQLREKNQLLEGEMSKVARVGKRQEVDFAEEVSTWAGVWISDKLPRNGDFILAYRAPNGDPLEPRILVDNKDKSTIAESDIDKLVRDAKERSIPVAALVVRDESQLRQIDRESRWSRKDGVWLLRTTRQWLPRDLDVLRPIFERMRVQGFDLLERNAVLAEEVRRTFTDIDRIDKELARAAKSIQSVSGLVARYRERLRDLCETAASTRIAPRPEHDGSLTAAGRQ